MNKPHNGKIIKCERCTKEFYVPLHRIDKARFCSRKCHNITQSENLKESCKCCGKEYSIIKSRIGKSKYCSPSCYNKAKTKPFPKFKCLFCGKEFHDEKRMKNRKYCSRKCIQKRDLETWNPSYSCVRKRLQIRGEIHKCEKCGYNDHPEILGYTIWMRIEKIILLKT